MTIMSMPRSSSARPAYLEAVVERDDLAGCRALDAAAAPLGRLAGRTVPAAASLAEVRRMMTAAGRRRAAVTSADGVLLGLLCLQASRAGFCSDQDVRARALGRPTLLSLYRQAGLFDGRRADRDLSKNALCRAVTVTGRPGKSGMPLMWSQCAWVSRIAFSRRSPSPPRPAGRRPASRAGTW